MDEPCESLLALGGPMPKSKVDDVFRLGRYSLIFCIACELTVLMQAGNLLFMVFGGAPPKLKGCAEFPAQALAESTVCTLYHAGNCTPILDAEFESINSEMSFICDDATYVKDSTSIQMLGYMLGSLIFGQISDAFGRKWPMFVTVLCTGVFGIAATFSTNIYVFTALRLLTVFFNTGHVVVIVVYMCEQLPSRHRMWLNFVINWSPNILFVTLLAYVLGSWRRLCFTLNVLCIPICESIQWLLRRGKVEQAVAAAQSMAKLDGVDLPEEETRRAFEQEVGSVKRATKRYFFQHLFCSLTLISYTITMIVSYMCVGVFNYGIMFNLETLSGSLYSNLIAVSVLRVALNLASAAVDFKCSWVGRLKAHYFFACYAAGAVVVIVLLQIYSTRLSLCSNYSGLNLEYTNLVRCLVLSASSMASQIFLTNQVTLSEIFPTPIRNIAYAMTQLSGSLGSVLGVQLFKLSSVWASLPYVFMVGLILSESTMFVLFIPESKSKPMAQEMPPPSERLWGKQNFTESTEKSTFSSLEASKEKTSSPTA